MKQKPIKETVNKAITRYFTKDGKEITETEYYGRKKAPEKSRAQEE